MKVKIAAVVRAGTAERQDDAPDDLARALPPSMIAASSSSRGMPRKNWSRRKMKKASTASNFGTTRGKKESIQPKLTGRGRIAGSP